MALSPPATGLDFFEPPGEEGSEMAPGTTRRRLGRAALLVTLDDEEEEEDAGSVTPVPTRRARAAPPQASIVAFLLFLLFFLFFQERVTGSPTFVTARAEGVELSSEGVYRDACVLGMKRCTQHVRVRVVLSVEVNSCVNAAPRQRKRFQADAKAEKSRW